MAAGLAVVLMSGGMDSAVCAAIAREEGYDIAALHLNYGQRTERKELEAFHALADFYQAVQRLVVSVEHLAKIGGSSLVDEQMAIPEPQLNTDRIPNTYVPFRNAHILAIATSWAEVLGANVIFYGAVQEDSSGYPDCRQEFIEAYQRVIDVGTKPETAIVLKAPLLHRSKAEIVQLGASLGVPFHLTWSCYQSEDHACGVCESCALRLRGFQLAGIEDPIPYIRKPWYAGSVAEQS